MTCLVFEYWNYVVNSFCKPFLLISKACLSQGKLLLEWRKTNVVPIHKKGNKQKLKNCTSGSLAPISDKIFVRWVYNNVFKYLVDKVIPNWYLILSHDIAVFWKKPTIFHLCGAHFVNFCPILLGAWRHGKGREVWKSFACWGTLSESPYH